jgi:hypothetical protein
MSTDIVFDSTALYQAIRRRSTSVRDGVALHRLRFTSKNLEHLALQDRGWEENRRFEYFMFLPEHGVAWDSVVIVLNGLNDSNYRKFFPWAASFARAGTPSIIFPTAFLMNRRPRAWVSPQATEAAFFARAAAAPDTATPTNAVLSHRIASDPRSLLCDALQTVADVSDLACAIRAGMLRLDSGAMPLVSGARPHLLGYSLGGYVALAAQLAGALPAESRVITFCAGASVNAPAGVRADPVSPYILDAAAANASIAGLASQSAEYAALDNAGKVLLELLCGASPELRARVAALGSSLTVCGSQDDRVVPADGIAENLGRLDRVFATGAHEYPFNLSRLDDPGASRLIAGSHSIDRKFAAVFEEFVRFVLVSTGCSSDHMCMPPFTANTCPVT